MSSVTTLKKRNKWESQGRRWKVNNALIQSPASLVQDPPAALHCRDDIFCHFSSHHDLELQALDMRRYQAVGATKYQVGTTNNV